MRVLVTGGAGFIGSHFAKRLARRGRGRRACSTSSPTPATRRTSTEPAIELVVGDICDPEAVARGGRGLRRDRQLRRRDARRPLDPRPGRVHPDERRRHAGAARSRPRRRDPARPRLDRRGLRRRARGRRRPSRTIRCGPRARTRRAKAGGDLQVLGSVRTYGDRRADHARLEHVRAEPVSGEADAALRHERARRRAAAGLRRRRADVATGCTSRITAPGSSSSLRAGPRRRGLQRRRRRGGDEPSRSRASSSSSPAPTSRWSAMSRTAPGTTAATRSTRRRLRRARLGAADALDGGLPADGRRGTATTATGGSRSSRASTASTTRSSTPRGSPRSS